MNIYFLLYFVTNYKIEQGTDKSSRKKHPDNWKFRIWSNYFNEQNKKKRVVFEKKKVLKFLIFHINIIFLKRWLVDFFSAFKLLFLQKSLNVFRLVNTILNAYWQWKCKQRFLSAPPPYWSFTIQRNFNVA